MPSPFPGMNPYLEQADVWHDFHQSWVPRARDLLTEQVRPRYIVKVEEHLYIHEPSAAERFLVGQADVVLAKRGTASRSRRFANALQAPASCQVVAQIDVQRQSYLEIRDRQSRELVTVIELLSPSNKKRGPDREQYLAKRLQVLGSLAHLVEIDLLRGGPRMPLKNLPKCAYYVLVSRAEERPQAGIWPIQLRDVLPVIPIPLRTPDDRASLNLQDLLHRQYDAAGYEDYIYSGTPRPPLSPADASWARRLIGKR